MGVYETIAIVHLVVVVLAAWRALSRASLFSAYWVTTLIVGAIYLPFPSSIIFPEVPDLEAVGWPFGKMVLFIVSFNLLVLLVDLTVGSVRGVRFGSWASIEDRRARLVEIWNSQRFWSWSFGAFVLSWLLLAYTATGSISAVFYNYWTDVAERYEGQTQYAYVLSASAFSLFSYCLPLAIMTRRFVFAIFIAISAYSMAQVLGSRALIIGPILASGTVLLNARFGSSRFPKIWRAISALLISASAYFLLLFTAWARSRYSPIEAMLRLPEVAPEFFASVSFRSDPALGAAQFVFAEVPTNISFIYGRTYLEMILMPIPRFLLDMLSDDLRLNTFSGLILAEQVYGVSGTARFGSIHPTIWGDAYMNFGWYGVLLGFPLALLIGLCDRFVSRSPLAWIIFFTFVSQAIIIFVRGSMLHATLYLLYPAYMGYLLYRLLIRSSSLQFWRRAR